jgi:hypothetical protein
MYTQQNLNSFIGRTGIWIQGLTIAKQVLLTRETHLQSSLLLSFWKWGGGLMNYLPWEDLNHDASDLSLPSS